LIGKRSARTLIEPKQISEHHTRRRTSCLFIESAAKDMTEKVPRQE